MGRGLSDQQRRILAAAVALNAHRNGGTPRAAELVIDRPAGAASPPLVLSGGGVVELPPSRYRFVLSRSEVDIFDRFVLAAFAGFKPGYISRDRVEPRERRLPVSRSDRRRGISSSGVITVRAHVRRFRHRWDPETMDHKRRVSVARAFKSIVRRELVLRCPGPGYFAGMNWSGLKRSFTPDERVAAEIEDDLRLRGDNVGAGYYLTAPGIDAAGDRWQELNVDELLEHWETARRIR